MLASTCSIRFFSLALVKFLSRLFTALNLLPSMAATAWPNRASRRQRTMNWRQTAREPHQLDIAARFPFQPTARLQAVEIAVEVNLQQRRGMIGRPSRRRRRHPRKSQGGKVQLLDEDLDHPNRVLLADIIFQAVRQQRLLHAIFAIDEPMHRSSPQSPKLRDYKADSPRMESA